MAIQSGSDAHSHAKAPGGETTPPPFSAMGTTSSSADFFTLSASYGMNQVSPEVQPYLDKVIEGVKTIFPSVRSMPLVKNPNTFAIVIDAPVGKPAGFLLRFVGSTDHNDPKNIPFSHSLEAATQEFESMFDNVKPVVVGRRVLMSNFAPEMGKAELMAITIANTFRATVVPTEKKITAEFLRGCQFETNWNIGDVRSMINQLSPHGVSPRVDVGVILVAKVKNEFSLGGQDYRTFPVGVIGGYTDFPFTENVRRVDGTPEVRQKPVFFITSLMTQVPSVGIASILMAAMVNSLYNSTKYLSQWANLSPGNANPGMLEEDPQRRGNPYEVSSPEDLKTFAAQMFGGLEIGIQFQNGRDTVPLLWRMVSENAQMRQLFWTDLTEFFQAPEEHLNVPLASKMGESFEGVFGDVGGELRDTRVIDYLKVAADSGFGSVSPADRDLFLHRVPDPVERARLVNSLTGLRSMSYRPLYHTNMYIFNPTFFAKLGEMIMRAGITITDPHAVAEARQFSSVASGFGSASEIVPVVTNGNTIRSYGNYGTWNL